MKFKREHKDAIVPKRAFPTDAGLDLTAVSMEYHTGYVEYDTGIAVEIPKGFMGFLCARSSVTSKDLVLKNAVGIIDETYRGTLKFRYWRTNGVRSNVYHVGERVGQLIVVPIASLELEEVSELSDTTRGNGGYGSTGK